MAVASGEKALSALTRLVSGDRIEVQSILRDCYLPKGLEPSNSRILMKPGTLMGEYGNEARYALAPDQATRCEIARPPADVLSGRPMISSDEAVHKYVKRSLDLTMKGGTTSGVVYPLAICELATDFRFRNVGGTSAGAIVAALTAAAELGRSGQVLASCQSSQKESPQEEMPATENSASNGTSQERNAIRPGFTGLADIISWLTQIRPGDPEAEEYRLAQLFRPGRATAPIFRVVVAIMRGRRLSLPLLALFAFGWGTPLLAIALLLGAVVLTGWLETRFAGAIHSVPAIVGFGALGLLAVVLFASGLALVSLSIRSVLAVRRHPAAWVSSPTEQDTRLLQLRNHTSQYPMRRRRTGLRVVIGVAMIVAALVLGFLRPVLYVIAPLVGLAAGLIMLFGLFLSVFNYVGRFGSRAFGLVLGSASERQRSPLDVLAGVPKPTVDKSLIPWLNDCLNALAGLPAHEALRFGHLWSGLDYHTRRGSPSQNDLEQWRLMWERRDHRLVNLELMTTDLTRQRPFRFPLDPTEGDDSERLWVCVDQLHDGESHMFPEPIMKALREGKRRDVRDDHGRMLRLYQLPDQRDLPVIFVVRMSMSLPALFQAVRLYRIQPQIPPQDDFGRALGDHLQLRPLGSSTESAQELWFSDGGITSNFPVHFFDNALPRWPTVSLDLGIHPDDAPHQDIWLPQDWESAHTPVKTLGGSGLEFGQAIFNTAMSWRDSLQSSLPGYRNRIAQVRTSPGEGGTNLFMPREVIEEKRDDVPDTRALPPYPPGSTRIADKPALVRVDAHSGLTDTPALKAAQRRCHDRRQQGAPMKMMQLGLLTSAPTALGRGSASSVSSRRSTEARMSESPADQVNQIPDTMQAVICHGPENYKLEEVPVPRPGPAEALIKVEATGICASDLKCYHGAAKFWGDANRPAWAETEVIPGHEFVGTVVQLDDVAASRWGIAVGDRVVAEQIVPCWKCRYCLNGEYWMCAPHDMFGFKRRTPGGMAEYMVYNKDALVYKISSDLPPAHAAFTEPLSCALHGVERGDIKFDDVVVVAGCGPIGLGMIAGAKSKNPKTVVALDMAQDKLELAKECGADVIINIGSEDAVANIKDMTGGYGADVYLEGTGHPSAVAQGLNLLRKLGTYVEYSVFGSDVSVDWSIISDDKELDVRGAHLGPGCWPAAIRMIESGRLPMDKICTHQLPLAEFQKGLDMVASGKESIKVSLIP